MNSSESAETVVKIALEGTEFALKMSGSAISYLAPIILAKLQEKKESPGKTKLINLLKSEKPIKVFSVKEQDIKEFRKQAKRYGITFCELKKKKNDKDGIIDILVKAEDAARINRIIDRFKLSEFSEEEIKSEISKDLKANGNEFSKNDELVKDILSKPSENIPLLKEENSQSENSLKTKNNRILTTSSSKPSVKEKLKLIEDSQENKNNISKQKTQVTKHYQPKIKKRRRNKDERQ